MIQFANPAALWFLTLLIPILLLYLLKRKRQDKIVPSILLWKQALEDTHAYTPFQKLRSNLLLLLQILVVVLLTALLAEPYVPSVLTQKKQWIFVIDRSASMQALDVRPDRFAAAKKKLLENLRSVQHNDEVMLISVGSDASIAQNFTENRDAVKKKLDQIEPEDVAAEWDQLALILKPLLKSSPKPGVVIASDFANFPEASMQLLPLTALRVGEKSDNLAITQAAMEPLSGSNEQLLFFQVKNLSSGSKSSTVEIHQNRELLDAYELKIDSNGVAEKSLQIPVVFRSQIQIQLKPSDSFSLDDDFVLIPIPRSMTPVHLELKDPFLKHAIEILPDVEVNDSAQITVSDRLKENPGIYFLGGDLKNVAPVVEWDQAIDPLRFVDAGLWRISNYQILTLPSGARELLETTGGVTAYTQQTGLKRRIILGFRLEDSNLSQLAGFPIFLQNAFEWINAGLHPQLPTVTNSDYPQEGEIEKGAGFLNFADARESDIKPGNIRTKSHGETQATILRKDFANWFLLGLLAMIILEWWAFHRRE
jgi:Aerotolerance regulator N-terminal/von Willebrand factor type A domain